MTLQAPPTHPLKSPAASNRIVRIALLHLAPSVSDLYGNRQRLYDGVVQAAAASARWVLTPELSTSGYSFADVLGLDWIEPGPASWTSAIRTIAAARDITVFLAEPERDPTDGLLYNSLFVFDRSRGLVGRHRKINTLKVGSEAWSTPGCQATIVDLQDFGRVGLLICADACSPDIAADLRARGARALVSSANWAPGLYGPSGEWEDATVRTGLPMFVCNRTGDEAVVSFSHAESVVAAQGARRLAFHSGKPELVLVDWDFGGNKLVNWSHTELRRS